MSDGSTIGSKWMNLYVKLKTKLQQDYWIKFSKIWMIFYNWSNQVGQDC